MVSLFRFPPSSGEEKVKFSKNRQNSESRILAWHEEETKLEGRLWLKDG